MLTKKRHLLVLAFCLMGFQMTEAKATKKVSHRRLPSNVNREAPQKPGDWAHLC